jgi:hypothetical protein
LDITDAVLGAIAGGVGILACMVVADLLRCSFGTFRILRRKAKATKATTNRAESFIRAH